MWGMGTAAVKFGVAHGDPCEMILSSIKTRLKNTDTTFTSAKMHMEDNNLDLFGGNARWCSSDWTASDDRVRGGKSRSYLDINHDGKQVVFKGNLDIETLGGAGFASQRTVSDEANWDLSAYDGVEIVIDGADAKSYTFNVKDTLLPRDPDTGREQSTISYEFDFKLSDDSRHANVAAKQHTIWIPWKDLTATFRGREKKDAPKLKISSVKRFGIMCRSFFGEQQGDFKLIIEKITAVKLASESVGKEVKTITAASSMLDGENKRLIKSSSVTDLEKAQGPAQAYSMWWNRRSQLALSILAIVALMLSRYIPMPWPASVHF